jgi:hypothetical protein
VARDDPARSAVIHVKTGSDLADQPFRNVAGRLGQTLLSYLHSAMLQMRDENKKAAKQGGLSV